MATSKIGVVWGLAKCPELQLSGEELHALVYSLTKKDSIRRLNQRELDTVIRELGRRKDSVSRVPKKQGATCTDYQKKKVRKLAESMGWDKPSRVGGMCRRMFGVDSVDWLTYQQCSKLIEALKAMAGRMEEQNNGGLQADPDSETGEGQCPG